MVLHGLRKVRDRGPGGRWPRRRRQGGRKESQPGRLRIVLRLPALLPAVGRIRGSAHDRGGILKGDIGCPGPEDVLPSVVDQETS